MIYLLVFNNNQSTYSNTDIYKYISESEHIDNWWHYLPTTYILKSKNSSKSIADDIIQKFPNLLFLIIKADLNDTNGVLPKKAWDWIGSNQKRKTKIKSLQARGKIVNKNQAENYDFLSEFLNLNRKAPEDPLKKLSEILGKK